MCVSVRVRVWERERNKDYKIVCWAGQVHVYKETDELKVFKKTNTIWFFNGVQSTLLTNYISLQLHYFN